jgi:hypothetical protein
MEKCIWHTCKTFMGRSHYNLKSFIFPFSIIQKKFHINYILQKEMSCSKTTQHKLCLIYFKT